MVALLAEGVDRNTMKDGVLVYRMRSPSSRRAWIEIVAMAAGSAVTVVALLAEGVDRNKLTYGTVEDLPVALLAEGVDRNFVGIPERMR